MACIFHELHLQIGHSGDHRSEITLMGLPRLVAADLLVISSAVPYLTLLQSYAIDLHRSISGLGILILPLLPNGKSFTDTRSKGRERSLLVTKLGQVSVPSGLREPWPNLVGLFLLPRATERQALHEHRALFASAGIGNLSSPRRAAAIRGTTLSRFIWHQRNTVCRQRCKSASRIRGGLRCMLGRGPLCQWWPLDRLSYR